MKMIFIILLILLFSSCEKSTEQKDLCNGVQCKIDEECSEVRGICVKKVDTSCFKDEDCTDGYFCDLENSKCKKREIVQEIICKEHSDCEIWELCNFSEERCKVREGMCNESSNCTNSPNVECNLDTHVCQDPHNCLYTGCEDWQRCDSDGVCNLKDGYCSQNSDCDNKFPYTECNEHSCIIPTTSCSSYTECKNFEYCKDGICKANVGSCNNYLDCIDGDKTVCDLSDNLCKTPEATSCLTNGCLFWQTCNETTGACELPNGSCNDLNDCNEREICNTAHKCERDDCTTHGCRWWQECNENTGVCNAKDSMCSSQEDCIDDTPYTKCNTLVHFCIKPDDIECTRDGYCKEWEVCNNDTNSCELKEGSCVNDEQCSTGEYCNTQDYRCYIEEQTCEDDISICDYWEKCESRACRLKDGYCINDNNCAEGEECNEDIHKCIEIDNSECSPYETTECYTASISTMGKGDCISGVKECSENSTWSTECIGEITPIEEICNDNIDNNCNGLTDENCNVNNNSFILFYSETDISNGKVWKFKNLNTNTYITVTSKGFSASNYIDMKAALTYSFEYQSSEAYKTMVINKIDWTYTNLSGVEIYNKMLLYLNQNNSFPITAYQTTWPWSSVMGYTSNGEVFLNTRKNWDTKQYGDTITHELMHMMGFGHGSNTFTQDKVNSVPYFIGYAVKDYIIEQ